MEPWEITLAAGKIAQGAAEKFARENQLNPVDDEEVLQVLAGRVFAVLTRLEELEEELLNRCTSESDDGYIGLGVDYSLGIPEEEIKAWQTTNVDDPTERIKDAAASIDAACLFDEQLRYNRARSLLGMFLHEIEGPGLRRNNVEVPCMDVDFLSEDEWNVLFGMKDEGERTDAPAKVADSAKENKAEQAELREDVDKTAEKSDRPSLHPITIDAIEEAFRLRALNSTTSPLRLIDAQTEWYEVQYSIVSFADRFLEKYTKPSSKSDGELLQMWTAEELQTIGGRIVGVLMRLDDLEWEWNNRISTSSLGEAPGEMWKTTLGLYPDNIEQNCLRTLDNALLEEVEFARARAERMLALFLLNIEGPGLKASGDEVPGGSHPDFIEDSVQLELMMPRRTEKK